MNTESAAVALTGEAGEQVPPLLLLAPGQHALHAAAARRHITHDCNLGRQAATHNAQVFICNGSHTAVTWGAHL